MATVALDRETGNQLWKQVAPTTRIEQVHRVGSPASSTPACDGQRVYVFFGSYGLLCYDLDGDLVWSKPMEPFQDEFGSSSSPILIGDKVILNEDHDINNFLIAINKYDGQTVWQVSRDEFTRGYSTPTIWNADGTSQIVVAGALQLAAYDVDTGEKLWWVDGLARIVNPVPVVQEDRIFVSTWSPGGDLGERVSMEPWAEATAKFDQNGDRQITRDELSADSPVVPRFFRIDLNQDNGIDQAEWEKHAAVFDRAQNATLAIRPHGKGDITATAVLWTESEGAPYVASPLLHNNALFLSKDGGILTTLDAESGKLIKRGRLKGRGAYYSSPVTGDGKVYVASEGGVLSVATDEGKWSVLSTRDFGERIYATPVIRDGKVYVRTEAALYCFAAE